MTLKEKLTADMKDAMKAKDAGKQRLSVIRLVRGAIRQLEIDGKKELQDEDVLGVISKEVKQRRDSIEDFKKGGRDDLVAEAKQLVASGVKELIVIAQDTTYYGLDLYGRRALGQLLERLATESGAPWIRLHYTYPSSFPIDAIDAIARHPNICNYIDIPLQHLNSRILSSMQRGIDREGTLRLLAAFREKLPDVAIRTTLIVGYPGETEAEFEELKEFVRQARFDRMGCFAYSPEEGTPAEKLGDTVPQEEKERRVDELMAIQEAISLEKNQARVGHIFRCLVDRREGEYLIARTEYDSPEIDDEVLIRQNHAAIRAGDFVQVHITQALENDLLGELV